MSRCPALLPIFLTLLLASPGVAQEVKFDPRRRVLLGRGVPTHSAWLELSGKIRDLERGRRWRFFVAIVNSTALPLPKKADAILDQWRGDPRFFPERSFLVVASIEQGQLALMPPPSVRDPLALTLRELAGAVRPHANRLRSLNPKTRASPQGLETLAREVAALLEGFDRRIDARQGERQAHRIREAEAQEDLSKTVAREANAVSKELEGVEQRVLVLQHQGVQVDRARELCEVARRTFATALDAITFDPRLGREKLERTRQLLAQASVVVGRVEEAGEQYRVVQPQAFGLLQDLETELDGEAAKALDPRVRRKAQADVDAARRQLMEGESQFDRRHPLAALSAVEAARDLLRRARTRLEPAQEPVESVEDDSQVWLIPAVVILALFLLAVGLAALVYFVRREEFLDEAEDLSAATRRMADKLRLEVLALRKLYLTASKPTQVRVPEELLPAAPPLPKRLQGVTHAQLEQAWAELESLHSLWRSLEQALVLHRALRREASLFDVEPLVGAINVLNDVPSRNLPVTRIRACASKLERLATAGGSAELMLEETALVVRHAEQSLEQILQAGHSTHSFDDAYADLVERSVEAALLASSDPVRSTRMAQEARREATNLDERIRRTLDLSAQALELSVRVSTLSNGAEPPPPEDLAAWSRHLGDELSAQLDEGLRDLAAQTLNRAAGLATDAERGGVRAPNLTGLREELREAMAALDELKASFHPASWEDLESALLRAGARIELMDEAIDEGRAVRVQARVSAIERSLLSISIRQLALQGQRERSVGLLDELDGRTQAIENFATREGEALHAETRGALARMRTNLNQLRATIHGSERVRWERALLDLQAAEKVLASLRKQASEDVLRYRRARILSKSLLDKRSELVKFLERRSSSPGAKTRIQGADILAERARQAATSSDHVKALFLLQEGVRAVMDARDVAFRGQRDKIRDGGVLGDAQNAILIAGQALGQASRYYMRGLVADPATGWELLADAKAEIESNPARALQLAEQATQAATDAVVTARLRAIELSDSENRQADARSHAQRDAREHVRGLVQQQERHRRARFEILILGEDPDLEEVDLDDETDAETELEVLEEVSSDALPEFPDEPPVETEAPTQQFKSEVIETASSKAETTAAPPPGVSDAGDADASAAETADDTPATETAGAFATETADAPAADAPATEAADDAPATETTDDTPAAEDADDTPATESTDDTPATETTDDTPATETTDDTPADDASDPAPEATDTPAADAPAGEVAETPAADEDPADDPGADAADAPAADETKVADESSEDGSSDPPSA